LGSGTDGGFTIGDTGDYKTVTTFEADIAAQLTGDLHGLHLDEETEIASSIGFDTDTNTHTLYLTAEVDCEHDGGAYGNGARINYPGYGYIHFDETTDGHLDDIEMSKLAIDASGNNSGLNLADGGNSGTWTVSRLLIKGDSNTNNGINKLVFGGMGTCNIINNIIYGLTAVGIKFFSHSATVNIYNNTVIGCYDGIRQDDEALNGTVNTKNNLVQNSSNADYVDDGAGYCRKVKFIIK
jgi:hypothetical protein